MPAQIGPLISNQAGYKTQALAEIVSNAIDASLVEVGIPTIGRFGIGSFQAIGLLTDSKD